MPKKNIPGKFELQFKEVLAEIPGLFSEFEVTGSKSHLATMLHHQTNLDVLSIHIYSYRDIAHIKGQLVMAQNYHICARGVTRCSLLSSASEIVKYLNATI